MTKHCLYELTASILKNRLALLGTETPERISPNSVSRHEPLLCCVVHYVATCNIALIFRENVPKYATVRFYQMCISAAEITCNRIIF